ncbi:hypothetical protein HZA96_01965 [Candidatus Woesearchaeota archaeon]|nr:hypothetical protein [Candidatus Woesearchaeota archaeon]
MQNIRVTDFNLQYSIESGQIFRYIKKNNGYYITVRDKLFFVKQQGDKIYYDGTNEEFVKHYLGLDEDYKQLIQQIDVDDNIKQAIKQYYGMRILRQDPWEATINFICSAAANIPKIRMNVNLLAEKFGKRIKLHDAVSYSFPEPGTMNNEELIRMCKTGFRSKYIAAANMILDDKKLAKLRTMPYTKAKSELMKVPGIGSKVADCILLFSYGFKEAFPVDTWITKIMKELYFSKMRNISNRKILEFGQNYFKAHPGYAQMYLFYWTRMKNKNGKKED